MLHSLASRFFIASLIILPALLVVFALSLDAAFRSSLLSGEEERLKTHSYLLLGEAFFFDDKLFMPESFREERFNQYDSGLYGIVFDDKGEEVWRSQSAELLELSRNSELDFQPGQTNFLAHNELAEPLFEFYYDVVFELDEGDKNLRFSVLHHQLEALAEQQTYRNQLWQSLSVIGILIIISQMIILRWGLKPLKKLAKDLVGVESGEAQSLTGNYPTEIQAVTDNLNQVLTSERQQRQRYRNTLDDLAHSLKTPLSIINGAITKNNGNKESDQTIAEQIDRMNQIISHQLKRAVVASPAMPQAVVAVKPVIERLVNSLAKVYQDKNIAVEIQSVPDLDFSGDERDLMEVMGNLIENAFKYCKSKVRISGEKQSQDILLVVEDDGDGVEEEHRQTILKRGARADTATTGQGIGLAIAVDIISSYQGSLKVDTSDLGGAKFLVTFSNSPV